MGFVNVVSFNQDLSGWCVTNIASERGTIASHQRLLHQERSQSLVVS